MGDVVRFDRGCLICGAVHGVTLAGYSLFLRCADQAACARRVEGQRQLRMLEALTTPNKGSDK
jgi:hypothetical protein